MNLPTEIFGDVVVAHTPEEIGDDQAEQLATFLTTLERNKVIVDIDGTESISSKGLGSLLDAQDSLRTSGGDVKISTANAVNRKILEITRLDEQLEVFDSVIDAVKSFV
jgi:anti-sigma B factor antagonist